MKLTWNDCAQSIFERILNRYKYAKEIHFVNDRYDLVHTIKDAEHQRRSQHYVSGTKNVYIKAHEMLPSKNEFSSYFRNSMNKIRLQEFLFERFLIYISSNLKKSEEHTFYYTRKKNVMT